MARIAGKSRVNRPYFFTDVNGDRVEIPAFDSGRGELEGNELSRFMMYKRARQIEEISSENPPQDNVLKVVYAIGQSLSVGGGQTSNSETPELAVVSNPPRPYSEYCLMLDTGARGQYASPSSDLDAPRISANDFTGIYEVYNGNNLGETHGTGLLERLIVAGTEGQRDTWVFRSGGRGGQAYADLAKGTAMYAHSLEDMQEIVDLAAGRGWTVEIVAMTVTHGEADRNAGTEDYISLLRQWKTDYQADVQAITGQASGPLFFVDQMSNPFNGAPLANQITLDQYDWAEEDPEWFMVAGKYYLPSIDALHLRAPGYRALGEYHGRAIRSVLDGNGWEPLKPVSLNLTGNVVDVVFNNSTPLVIDTTTVEEQSNYGFSFPYQQASGIASVELVGTDTVRLTLNEAPPEPAGSYFLNYAFNIRKGNLRDSSSDEALTDSLPLHNWAVSFRLPVTFVAA